MNKTTSVSSGFNTALQVLGAYLLEKDHHFDRGPSYETGGAVLPNLEASIRMYEGMGYTTLMKMGNPPICAMLERGHSEVYLFHIEDPKIHAWLEDRNASLNDASMRAYLLEKLGLQESDLPVGGKPHRFHINDVDDIIIISGDNRD